MFLRKYIKELKVQEQNKDILSVWSSKPAANLQALEKFKFNILNKKKKEKWRAIGRVFSAADGVARIVGLPRAQMGEILTFWDTKYKLKGLVLTLNKEFAKVAIFGSERMVYQNMKVTKTNEYATVVTGRQLLGRIVDSLGNAIDGRREITKGKKIKADRKAKGIIQRAKIRAPFFTGIISIDAMIPIGRGQRELIIGDRQTGKTSIALDSILIQNKRQGKRRLSKRIFCVYVAIGQKKSTVKDIARLLGKKGALHYTTIVSATADQPAALQYLAPYSGASIGEFYRDRGRDAVLIMDDLTQHAVAYRQMALLIRRPPGRSAYPGDVFYLHSRLLERGSSLKKKYKGGSLTMLPIIETFGNDVSAYIPTNVISITDGQIYVDKRVIRKGVRPPVNVGLSVSRIGSAAQYWILKRLAGKLKLQLTQYREVEGFISFVEEIDGEIWILLERGFRILEMFKQKRFYPYTYAEEILLLKSVVEGGWEDVPTEQIPFIKRLTLVLARRWRRHYNLKMLSAHIITEMSNIWRDFVEYDDEEDYAF